MSISLHNITLRFSLQFNGMRCYISPREDLEGRPGKLRGIQHAVSSRFYWSLIVFIGGLIVVTFAHHVVCTPRKILEVGLANARMCKRPDAYRWYVYVIEISCGPVINAKATNQLPAARANCRLEWRKLPQLRRSELAPNRKMRRAPKGPGGMIKKGTSRNLVTSVNPIKIHEAEFAHYDMQICQIWARGQKQMYLGAAIPRRLMSGWRASISRIKMNGHIRS